MVVEGNRIGRTIGFPTANLHIADRYKLLLPDGIYAARTEVNHQRLDAMLYIGTRPSINGASERRVEVNLIDFDGDLYGRSLRLDVLDFIRGDLKLDSLEALKQQIEADKKAILASLRQIDQSAVSSAVETSAFPEPETLQENQTPDVNVAVVILNYNTRRHLETFLPSVVEHAPGARIVVADNGSPDDSLPFLRLHYPDIEVIDLGSNFGFAQGYNEALRQVEADIYVILNSDVEVTAGWMQPVLDAFSSDPLLAIAQPKILAWRQKDIFEYAGAAGGWIDRLGYPFCRGRIFSQLETDKGQYDTPQPCFWAAGAAFFIRADVYHRFEGFDGDYFAHNEEIDLCWRIKRAGYKVLCLPASVVYHLGGGTLEYESPRKVFLNFRNSLYSLVKNERTSTLLWLLPARLVLDGLAAVRFVLKGQFRAVWSILEAHFSFYSHFASLVKKRRRTAELVEKHRVGPENSDGLYPGSIVWAHYARRIKTFSELLRNRT
jgi:GT2 family glycosyltransferase